LRNDLHFIACARRPCASLAAQAKSAPRQTGAAAAFRATYWCFFLLHRINGHNNQWLAMTNCVARNLLTIL
jgi:hypothetical protein